VSKPARGLKIGRFRDARLRHDCRLRLRSLSRFSRVFPHVSAAQRVRLALRWPRIGQPLVNLLVSVTNEGLGYAAGARGQAARVFDLASCHQRFICCGDRFPSDAQAAIPR